MASSNIRRVLTVSLLCGTAHPAFADGALPSEEALTHALIVLVVIVVIAIGSVVLIGRAIWRRSARPAAPQLPPARAVQDRPARKRER